MKTTNKYSAKLNQSAAETSPVDGTNAASDQIQPFSRDIILMRIRHIMKIARDSG
ncbi:MAG: hypothetical protein P8X57_07245 [Cyclobacteriaceae bacterium]